MDVFVRNKAYTGPVQAVVLDWAGTAVDHGSLGPVAVFQKVFQNRNVDVTPDEVRVHMGLMKKDHIRAIAETPAVAERWANRHGAAPSEADVDAMFEELEQLMTSVIARHSDPVPGLLETVAELRRRGVKIGSTTGYTRPMMEVLIPEARRKGYQPDATFCSSDAPSGRPYPWMCYLNAVELQVYPLEAMVKIGDTLSDVEEGLNAGMWTVGVTLTGNELGLSEPEVADLDPADLERRLEEIEERFLDAGAHYAVPGIRECPEIIDRIERRLADGERP
jgi:phosphonoacetaldehyde hydrolase